MAGETLVVDNRNFLVTLQLIMEVNFSVGVRMPVTIKWCIDNGPWPVGGMGWGGLPQR